MRHNIVSWLPLGPQIQRSPTEQASNPIYEIIDYDHSKTSPVKESIDTSYEEMMSPPVVRMTPEDVVTPEVELTENPAYTIH